MIEIYKVLLVLLVTIIGSFGSLELKRGANKFNLNPFDQIKNKHLIFGLCLFVISTGAYVYSLQGSKLSAIYSLTSLSYVWIAILSKKYLKETINFQKWAGIFIIILGVVIITYVG